MGADLYIQSLYGPSEKKWEPQFHDAVAARDKLTRGTPEYETAQRRVLECYEQMFSTGYFRDPYNSSNLLWQFGLSWWTDVGNRCVEGYLAPKDTAAIVELLAEREDVFRDNLAALEPDEAAYFEEEYGRLRAFLSQAIALNEPIQCSL